MMSARRALVLVLVGMLTATVTWAQSKESDPLWFSIRLWGETTDNRDSVGDDDKEDNVDAAVQPKIGVRLSGESSDIKLSYAPAYRYRSDPSPIQNEEEWHHDLDLLLGFQATPTLRLSVDERFNYTDDPSLEMFGSTLRRDSSYNMNRLTLSANAGLGERHSVTLRGHHMVKRYDDDVVGDESDEDRIEAGAGLRRQITRTVGVEFDVDWMDFDSENSLGLERGFQSIMAGVGVDKTLGENARADLRVGWQTVDYTLEELESEDSVFASLRVTGKPGAAARVTAEAQYGIRNSYAFPFVSQEHTHVFAEVLMDASQSIVFGLSAEYRIEDYSEETLPAAVRATREASNLATSGEETTLLAKAHLTLKLDDDFAVTLAQLYEDVDSDVFTTFTRNATRLSVSKRF